MANCQPAHLSALITKLEACGVRISASVRALEADLKAFAALVKDPHSNLYSKIPWGKNDQTLLREVLLAADHTSYHTGELVFLRRLLGAWK